MCSFHLDEGIWNVDFKFSLWRHRCRHHHADNISEVVCNCPFASVIHKLYSYFLIFKTAPIVRSQHYIQPKVMPHIYIYIYIWQLYFLERAANLTLYIDGVSPPWAESCRYNISTYFFNLWRHQCPRHQHQWLDGLAQDCSIFSALAMEILHSCTKPYDYIQIHWSMMHVYIPSLIMLFQFIF